MAFLPQDRQWDWNNTQDTLQERMKWAVMAIGKRPHIVEVRGQAEGSKEEPPEWRG